MAKGNKDLTGEDWLAKQCFTEVLTEVPVHFQGSNMAILWKCEMKKQRTPFCDPSAFMSYHTASPKRQWILRRWAHS